MKVYLAAQYAQKEEMKGYASQLMAEGIGVTSRWLDEPHSTSTALGDLPASDLRTYADTDLIDIDLADVFVFFSLPDTTPFTRGGRHVEYGYALASNMPILVVGPKENIFHYMEGVRHVDGWEDAKKWLLLMLPAIDAGVVVRK